MTQLNYIVVYYYVWLMIKTMKVALNLVKNKKIYQRIEFNAEINFWFCIFYDWIKFSSCDFGVNDGLQVLCK